MGKSSGFTRLVVDTLDDAVIGVHHIGPSASELVNTGVLAIEMAASPIDLAASIFAHPTLGEGLHHAARKYVESN